MLFALGVPCWRPRSPTTIRTKKATLGIWRPRKAHIENVLQAYFRHQNPFKIIFARSRSKQSSLLCSSRCGDLPSVHWRAMRAGLKTGARVRRVGAAEFLGLALACCRELSQGAEHSRCWSMRAYNRLATVCDETHTDDTKQLPIVWSNPFGPAQTTFSNFMPIYTGR